MKNMLEAVSIRQALNSDRRSSETIVLIGANITMTLGDLQDIANFHPKKYSHCPSVALQINDSVDFIKEVVRWDGAAHSVLLLAPDLAEETAELIQRNANIDHLVKQSLSTDLGAPKNVSSSATRWLITTSGTTGTPKVVEHRFDSLTKSVKAAQLLDHSQSPRWGLLYNPSRFAGIQVVLQSLLGGGVLLAPSSDISLAEKIEFFVRHNCSHLSGTPSLWRKMLMLQETRHLNLKQITLGGEIADVQILRALSSYFPGARLTHIYASTEIGVGFAVNDGMPGFPTSYLIDGVAGTRLKIERGVLWAKPPSNMSRASADHILTDDKGYVNTGDRVKIVDDRVFFLGRDSSVANVGGVKIQLEDVESVIRQCPGVSDCKVSIKANSFVGSVLIVEVVVDNYTTDLVEFKRRLKFWCLEKLQREAQPAIVKFVQSIAVTGAGKIQRNLL